MPAASQLNVICASAGIVVDMAVVALTVALAEIVNLGLRMDVPATSTSRVMMPLVDALLALAMMPVRRKPKGWTKRYLLAPVVRMPVSVVIGTATARVLGTVAAAPDVSNPMMAPGVPNNWTALSASISCVPSNSRSSRSPPEPSVARVEPSAALTSMPNSPVAPGRRMMDVRKPRDFSGDRYCPLEPYGGAMRFDTVAVMSATSGAPKRWICP